MTKNVEALDEVWFKKLHDFYQNDDIRINSFCKISETERRRFFENDVENPQFSLCPANILSFDEYQSHVLSFLEEVANSNANSVVKSVYKAKLERNLAFVPMYKAVYECDDKAFHKHSVLQYGKPKKVYFTYIAKRIKELLKATLDTKYTTEHKRLSKIFSKIDTKNLTISNEILPPAEDMGETVIGAKEAEVIFKEVLDRYDINGWQVVVDKEGKRRNFAINPTIKEIYIPSDRALSRRLHVFTEKRARAVAEHEIGVHVLRASNGSKQSLKLLSLGLAHSIAGEEGLASYVQQQSEGANEFYGFDRYMAISLAMGLDGHTRDFRSVFELIEAYYLLTLPADSENIRSSARNAAWATCVRIFRGSTGLNNGQVYTRDIIYFEGNINVWNLLIDKPHIFESLFVGKFDPLNKDHVDALCELEIIKPF